MATHLMFLHMGNPMIRGEAWWAAVMSWVGYSSAGWKQQHHCSWKWQNSDVDYSLCLNPKAKVFLLLYILAYLQRMSTLTGKAGSMWFPGGLLWGCRKKVQARGFSPIQLQAWVYTATPPGWSLPFWGDWACAAGAWDGAVKKYHKNSNM